MGLFAVESFAAERISAVDEVCGDFCASRAKLEGELPVIGDLSTGEIIGKEIEGEFLVPGAFDGDHFRVGFVTIEEELDFASAVPGEIEGSGSVAEVLAVDLDEGSLGVGVNRDAAVHAASLEAAEQGSEDEQSRGHESRSEGNLQQAAVGEGISDTATADAEEGPFTAAILALEANDRGGARDGEPAAGADECIIEFEGLDAGAAAVRAFVIFVEQAGAFDGGHEPTAEESCAACGFEGNDVAIGGVFGLGQLGC